MIKEDFSDSVLFPKMMGVSPAKAVEESGHSTEQSSGRYNEYIAEFCEADNTLLETKTQVK